MSDTFSSETLEKTAFKKALEVFHFAAEEIPAYREFLSEKGINPQSIKTLKDFQKIPPVDKKNYIVPNSLNRLLSESISSIYTLGCSSGTTGKIQYWPSFRDQDKLLPLILKRFFKDTWQIHRIPTMLINGLPSGAWWGGTTGVWCMLDIAMKSKYPFTAVMADSSFEEIKNLIAEFASHYKQIIIYSLPLFFRRLIDDPAIPWRKLNIKYCGTGMPISEAWREFILKKLEKKEESLNDIVSIYGASDVGNSLIGFETVFASLVRFLAKQNKNLALELFGQEDFPSVFQYSPLNHYIETYEGKILLTVGNVMPLVRYSIEDRGKILAFDEVEKILKSCNYDYKAILSVLGWNWRRVQKFPLLMVYGRADDTVFFNGTNIYQRTLEPVLYNNPGLHFINDYTLAVKVDEKGAEEKLVASIELKNCMEIDEKDRRNFKNLCARLFLEQLIKCNVDFATEYEENPEACKLEVAIYSFGTGPFSRKGRKNI